MNQNIRSWLGCQTRNQLTSKNALRLLTNLQRISLFELKFDKIHLLLMSYFLLLNPLPHNLLTPLWVDNAQISNRNAFHIFYFYFFNQWRRQTRHNQVLNSTQIFKNPLVLFYLLKFYPLRCMFQNSVLEIQQF